MRHLITHGGQEAQVNGHLTDFPAQKRIHTKALSPIWALGDLAPASVAPLAGSLAKVVCS
jgi:hypothetical protein